MWRCLAVSARVADARLISGRRGGTGRVSSRDEAQPRPCATVAGFRSIQGSGPYMPGETPRYRQGARRGPDPRDGETCRRWITGFRSRNRNDASISILTTPTRPRTEPIRSGSNGTRRASGIVTAPVGGFHFCGKRSKYGLIEVPAPRRRLTRLPGNLARPLAADPVRGWPQSDSPSPHWPTLTWTKALTRPRNPYGNRPITAQRPAP